MMVDCQLCGDRVPPEIWHSHLAEHQDGKRPVLPAVNAFERHTSSPADPKPPARRIPVRLWVTSIMLLEELSLDELPELHGQFEHDGTRYQIQSMQLSDVVDIVLNPGSSPPRPLTQMEVAAARRIPSEHSCGSACLRCAALRTGQL